MRRVWFLIGIALLALAVRPAFSQEAEAPSKLVREVVYNEMQDHNTHGLWRYWVEQHQAKDTKLQFQVETADGPVRRLLESNGRSLDTQHSQEEQARLKDLMNSPGQRMMRRHEYQEDEKHVTFVLNMLADAYLLEDAGVEGTLRHLHFKPDPAYQPHSIDAHVMRSLAGDLWIDMREKRLARLEGHFSQNVDLAYGLLGRLDKGGWFRMDRTQVSPTEWKTCRLEIHISGRAMLFKTLSRETSELRGGFAPVPAGTSFDQGLELLEQNQTASLPAEPMHVSSAAFLSR